MQLAVRFGAASIFFGIWVLMRDGAPRALDGTLASGALLGLLFSLEFIFMGQSLLHTTAAHTIVFLYTAPIFSALGLRDAAGGASGSAAMGGHRRGIYWESPSRFWDSAAGPPWNCWWAICWPCSGG